MKYPRTYHYHHSKGATNDDKISKFPGELIDRELILTEKMDGSNSDFDVSGVYGRSHAAPTQNPWDIELWNMYHCGLKDWLEYQCLEYGKDVNLFGENMYGVHSIEYEKLTNYFYCFGIRIGDTWVSWDDLVSLCDTIELNYMLPKVETVPLLWRGKVSNDKELKQLVDDFMNGESTFGSTIEGVVIRWSDEIKTDEWPYAVQKVVRPNHVTTDKHWSRNWKKAQLYVNKI